MPRSSKTTLTPEQQATWERGLRMLARMIAQAYLRDVRGAEASSTANPKSTTGAGDRTRLNSVDEAGATSAPDAAA